MASVPCTTEEDAESNFIIQNFNEKDNTPSFEGMSKQRKTKGEGRTLHIYVQKKN